MNIYAVVIAPVATEEIERHARYITEVAGSIRIAERWIGRVYGALGSLKLFPRRFELAEENAHSRSEA